MGIKNIELEVGDKVITLTEDEARQVYSDLDRLFGPGPVPWYPIHPVREWEFPKSPHWEITCENKSLPS